MGWYYHTYVLLYIQALKPISTTTTPTLHHCNNYTSYPCKIATGKGSLLGGVGGGSLVKYL